MNKMCTTEFADRMYIRTKVQEIKDLVDISSTPGNYDYDPYMHGLANGLILAYAILKEEEPVYLNPPTVWCYEKKHEENKDKYPTWIEHNS